MLKLFFNLNGNSSKLCMLGFFPYEDVDIVISVDLFLFEGVI
jgi:hypothetical protein